MSESDKNTNINIWDEKPQCGFVLSTSKGETEFNDTYVFTLEKLRSVGVPDSLGGHHNAEVRSIFLTLFDYPIIF